MDLKGRLARAGTAVLAAAAYVRADDIMTTLESINITGIIQWAFTVIKAIIVEFVGLLPYLVLIVVVGLVIYLIRKFMDMLPGWLGGFMKK